MLWPLVLPFQITCGVLAGAVALATLFAPTIGRRRLKAFVVGSAVACLAFMPSCMGVMKVLDAQRFGEFHHDTYDQVRDSRVERYLPPAARDITLRKHAQGHWAQYKITEEGLVDYIDECWEQHGAHSWTPRHEFNEKRDPAADKIELHSPDQADGGGASYTFDRTSGIATQQAGYW